ncbi:MAG: hypothetical protein LBK82_09380 [Planctomycetaceae bacterium]|nr:hypothetical protein [Planctomycetaceae bacterium]
MTSKRKAIQIAVVNPVHSRLTPTRCFSETSPTYLQKVAHLMFAYLYFDSFS